MTVISARAAKWRKVNGDIKTEPMVCPRCKNSVQYELVTDGDGIGFPGLFTIKYKRHYAYKCPICPSLKLVSNEEAKSIMKRG